MGLGLAVMMMGSFASGIERGDDGKSRRVVEKAIVWGVQPFYTNITALYRNFGL